MAWTAALIDSPPQSRKTRKAFDVLTEKLRDDNDIDILGLFITQANSTMSAMQILNRITHDDDLLELFPKKNIIRAKECDKKYKGNVMIVDFWNIRNTEKMLKIVSDYDWDKIVIIVDEVDMGSLSNRLTFINDVEKEANGCNC